MRIEISNALLYSKTVQGQGKACKRKPTCFLYKTFSDLFFYRFLIFSKFGHFEIPPLKHVLFPLCWNETAVKPCVSFRGTGGADSRHWHKNSWQGLRNLYQTLTTTCLKNTQRFEHKRAHHSLTHKPPPFTKNARVLHTRPHAPRHTNTQFSVSWGGDCYITRYILHWCHFVLFELMFRDECLDFICTSL